MSDTETMTGGDGSATLAALSDTERATWQMTGELPTPAAPVTEPDDDEPEPSPATEKPAAVSATPEKPISKRQQHINDLARGKAEAEQRAAAAERERDELRAARQTPPREQAAEPVKAKPVAPKQAFPKFEEWAKANPDAIDEAEPDAAWYAYQQAWNDWDYDRRRTAERATEAREAEFRTLSQHEEAFAAERAKLVTEIPDFDSAIAAVPKNSISLVMSRAALEAGPRATYWLATHPAERAELTDDTLYVDPNGPAFKGAVGLMRRHLLSQVLAPRENGNHDSPTTSTSASAGPAAKTVTTAPVPPVTLSARSGDPSDPLDAALKDRDFRRYEAEANARDLAGSKR